MYIEVLNGDYNGYRGILADNQYDKFSTKSNAKAWAILYGFDKKGVADYVEVIEQPRFEYMVIKNWKVNDKWRYLHERNSSKQAN